MSAGAPLCESFRALQKSAEAGCDFCTLCWTAVVEKHSKEQVENLLQGLTADGKAVEDITVVGKRIKPQPNPTQPPSL